MPVTESVITEIVKRSADKAWKALSRKERVLEILKSAGLKSGRPEPDFESVYAYTLVEFGIDRPKLILNFFRHEKIKEHSENLLNKITNLFLIKKPLHLLNGTR